MAQKRLNYADIKGLVATYINSAKIADPTWTPSAEAISGLMEKIMKTVYIDGNFADKLEMLDAEQLPFGESIEEFYTGLCEILGYNDNENNSNSAEDAMKPYRPTFDQVVYSERLGRKKIKTTIDYDKYDKACSNAGDYENVVNLVMKRLYDTLAQWKYGVKKGALGKLIDKAVAANAGTTYTTNSTVIKAGVIYVQSNKFYISKKNFSAAVNKSLATLKGEGDVTEITPSMVATIAAPVDTETGEAFTLAVKKAVEDSEFVTEGTSLSGSTVGAAEGLTLFILKGNMPDLAVNTLSGAFHREDLVLPAKVVVVDDFGSLNTTGAYALLCDARGIKLHNNYRALRQDANGDGDYVTYTQHEEDTIYLSNHTFVKVFVQPQA